MKPLHFLTAAFACILAGHATKAPRRYMNRPNPAYNNFPPRGMATPSYGNMGNNRRPPPSMSGNANTGNLGNRVMGNNGYGNRPSVGIGRRPMRNPWSRGSAANPAYPALGSQARAPYGMGNRGNLRPGYGNPNPGNLGSNQQPNPGYGNRLAGNIGNRPMASPGSPFSAPYPARSTASPGAMAMGNRRRPLPPRPANPSTGNLGSRPVGSTGYDNSLSRPYDQYANLVIPGSAESASRQTALPEVITTLSTGSHSSPGPGYASTPASRPVASTDYGNQPDAGSLASRLPTSPASPLSYSANPTHSSVPPSVTATVSAGSPASRLPETPVFGSSSPRMPDSGQTSGNSLIRRYVLSSDRQSILDTNEYPGRSSLGLGLAIGLFKQRNF